MERISKIFLLTFSVSLLICLLVIPGVTQNEKPKLTITIRSWPSAEVNAHIMGFIAEHAYGHPVEYQGGATAPIVLGLRRGDIDIDPESWTGNTAEPYNEGFTSETLIDLGQCYPDAPQGWFVPTYVIEGDEERGIEPMAPDLESILDLKKYWKVFQDPEDPDKGRFYGAPSVWTVADHDTHALEVTGLDEYFNQFDTGSNAGLVAAIAGHIEKGQPIFFYYWGPTWILGKYDVTMLEFPPEVKEFYPDRTKVHIVAHPSLAQKAPRVLSFLTNYQTTLDQQGAILFHMQKTGASSEETAIWFLKNYKEVWHKWFPEVAEVEAEVIQAVEDALAKE